MINVLWIVTRLIPGGTKNIILWSLELLQQIDTVSNDAHKFRFFIASGPEGVDENLKDVFKTLGVTFYVVPHLHRTPNIINDLLALKELKQLLRLHDFKIAHTHTSKAGYLGRLAAKQTGIPVIIHTPHGHVFNNFFNGVWGWAKTKMAIVLEKQAAKWCHAIVALSHNEADDYKRLEVKPKKEIVVIPNGLPSYLIQNNPASITPTGTTIGFAGRLVPEKGVIDLLEAFSIVHKNMPTAKLLIAGDGPLKKELILICNKKHLTPYIEFLGHQKDLSSFWNAIDLFVLPSHSEGFGLALLEAMAQAKGIVATKAGGIPDVIEDGVTGMLVPYKQPELLAKAILNLINNPVKLFTIGLSGWRRLNNFFKLENNIKKLINLYKSLLESNDLS